MLRILTSTLFILVALSCAFGCGGGARLAVNNQQPYYLLTNLRAHGAVVSSRNPWTGETMLPACTQVQIGSARGREIRFTANGQDYRYQIYRRSSLPLEAHFQRIFGTGCPNIQAMSPVEQAGVQRGLPYQGMSKGAVIIAMGYPPDDETAALEGPTWTYVGQTGRITATFTADVLTSITGNPGDPILMAAAQSVPVAPPVTSTTTTGTASATTNTTTGAPEDSLGKVCGQGQPECHPELVCHEGTCQRR